MMGQELMLPTPQAAEQGMEKWANFDITAARRALEAVALGKSLLEIEQDPSLPPAKVFMQWVMLYPDMARHYSIARELSGFMLEEEALYLARYIRLNPAKTALEQKAIELLVNQLRWSAGKRNPGVFSDKAALNVTVPIQINTSLDLGSEQKSGTKEFPNIYDMTANLDQAVPIEEVPIDVLERELAKAEGRPAAADPGTEVKGRRDAFSKEETEKRRKQAEVRRAASAREREEKARAQSRRARPAEGNAGPLSESVRVGQEEAEEGHPARGGEPRAEDDGT